MSVNRRQAVRRLLAIYGDTDTATRQDGREWYRTAAATVSSIGGTLPHDRAAAIVAVLSPRERWRRNIFMARELIEGREVTGLGGSIGKAKAILSGAPIGTGPGDGLGGPAPKVRAFWANLCGDGEAVTVDVWATRAATGGTTDAPGTPKRYGELADAYRAAARKVGERPCDFQAIIWLAVRPSTEHRKDTDQIGAMA